MLFILVCFNFLQIAHKFVRLITIVSNFFELNIKKRSILVDLGPRHNSLLLENTPKFIQMLKLT